MRRDLVLAGLALAVFLAVTAGLAAGGVLINLDLAVHAWSEAHRPAPLEQVARILNRLGQGGALLGICAALAGWLALLRWRRGAGWWHAAWPVLPVLAGFLLVYTSVAAIKRATTRGAPSCEGLAPEYTVRLLGTLVCPDGYAAAYPSGHAVNTVVWYGVLVLLGTALLRAYGRPGPPPVLRWAVRLAPPAIVVVAQTYLSFHWVTDSLAGLALGLAIDRVLHLVSRPVPRVGRAT